MTPQPAKRGVAKSRRRRPSVPVDREALTRLLQSHGRLISLAGITTCACDPDDWQNDGCTEAPETESHRCDEAAAAYVQAQLDGRDPGVLAPLPEPVTDFCECEIPYEKHGEGFCSTCTKPIRGKRFRGH